MSSQPARRLAYSALCAMVLLGIAAPTAFPADGGSARDRGRATEPVLDTDALLAQTRSLSGLDGVLDPVIDLLRSTLAADNGRLPADQVATYRTSIEEVITELSSLPAAELPLSRHLATPASPSYPLTPALPQRPVGPTSPPDTDTPKSPGTPKSPDTPKLPDTPKPPEAQKSPVRPPLSADPSSPDFPWYPFGPSSPAVPPGPSSPAVPPEPGDAARPPAAARSSSPSSAVEGGDAASRDTSPADAKREAVTALDAAVDALLAVVSSGGPDGSDEVDEAEDLHGLPDYRDHRDHRGPGASAEVEPAAVDVLTGLADVIAVTLLGSGRTPAGNTAGTPDPAPSADTASPLPLLPTGTTGTTPQAAGAQPPA